MARGGAAGTGGGLAIVDDVAGDAALEEGDTLLGHTLEVEGEGKPARVAAIVPEIDGWGGQLFAEAAAQEAAAFLDGLRAKADVGEIGQHLLDGVGLEDDAVLAWLDGDRIAATHGLVYGLARQRLRLDGGHV